MGRRKGRRARKGRVKVQTIVYKLNKLKDIFYRAGNIVNIL